MGYQQFRTAEEMSADRHDSPAPPPLWAVRARLGDPQPGLRRPTGGGVPLPGPVRLPGVPVLAAGGRRPGLTSVRSFVQSFDHSSERTKPAKPQGCSCVAGGWAGA
jgi:hypothetical protein